LGRHSPRQGEGIITIFTSKAKRGAIVSAIALTATLGAISAPAGADASVQDVASGLAGPLQFAVASNNTIYVGQDFSGTLTEISASGARKDLDQVQGPGEIAGVDAKNPGDVIYSKGTFDEQGNTTSFTLNKLKNGVPSVVADAFGFESTRNPDQKNEYGFIGLDPQCASQLPPEIGPPTYHGIVDSHPYSAVLDGHGGRYVGEAAGNDILHVSATGQISVVSLFPAQPFTVTASAAQANGLPACTVGRMYRFEPVPTDIEWGTDGNLYVTTLPGGPEDPSLGARGSVYQVNPTTGFAKRIVTGLAGATNLAIKPDGTIYVTELFANRVSKIVNGAIVPVINLEQPAAIEYANGTLWVAYHAFGNGTIAKLNG
jgi:hypothetical protein